MGRRRREPLLPEGHLREARVRAGLSQHEVAERLEVTQATVSNWEVGRSSPTRTQVERLGVFLDLSLHSEEDDDSASSSSAFGEWLARVRTERGLTRRELAEQSGVSEPQIFNIEKGKTRNPRQETQAKLSGAIGQDVPDETKQVTEADAEIPDVGVLTDFDPHAEDDWPTEPGVYVLYDISDRPVYVGESDNIRQRLGTHSDRFWFKAPIVETAAYVRIAEQRLRRQVEATMIRFMKSNAVINKQNVRR